MTPATMAEAVKLIDELRAELASTRASLEILRSERDLWRSGTGR